MRDAAFKVEEVGGGLYPDLETALQLARGSVGRALADAVRRLLDEGVLVVENGVIVPARGKSEVGDQRGVCVK